MRGQVALPPRARGIEGDGIEFAEAFAKENGCRVRPHHKFGTAVVIFPDGFKIDVATARVEYYLEPAALPTVEYSSIKLDLYRRDFTINTLAVHLNPERFGELIDFYGAQQDNTTITIPSRMLRDGKASVRGTSGAARDGARARIMEVRKSQLEPDRFAAAPARARSQILVIPLPT